MFLPDKRTNPLLYPVPHLLKINRNNKATNNHRNNNITDLIRALIHPIQQVFNALFGNVTGESALGHDENVG
jgi:hypothetical protein